jgi:hypothetical protein
VDVGKKIRRSDREISWENILEDFHSCILLGKSASYCTVSDVGGSGDVGNRNVVVSEGVDYAIHFLVGSVLGGCRGHSGSVVFSYGS